MIFYIFFLNSSEKYSKNDNFELKILKPKINSIIAAQYSKDSYWYRAKVTAVNNIGENFFFLKIDIKMFD
jgi:hypothetical protein